VCGNSVTESLQPNLGWELVVLAQWFRAPRCRGRYHLRSTFIVHHNIPHIEAWALVLADQFAPKKE